MEAMRRRARGARVARGGVAASIATFVALLSHVTGGGAVPGWIGIVVPLALSFVACTVLAGRRLSAWRLSAAVVVSQLLFHALFVLGSYDLGAAGHVHGAVVPALAADPVGAALAPDATMWLWHALAAAVTSLALHRAERTLGVLRALAGRAVEGLRARVRVMAAAFEPVSPRHRVAVVVAVVRPTSVLLAASARRRGPPVSAS